MSIKAFKWAKKQTGLGSPAKFVLLTLADFYNDGERRAWPSQATIATATELSSRTVIRAIQRLEMFDLVRVERWVNAETGVSLPNRYCLPHFDPRSVPDPAGVVYAVSGFNLEGVWESDRVSAPASRRSSSSARDSWE